MYLNVFFIIIFFTKFFNKIFLSTVKYSGFFILNSFFAFLLISPKTYNTLPVLIPNSIFSNPILYPLNFIP